MLNSFHVHITLSLKMAQELRDQHRGLHRNFNKGLRIRSHNNSIITTSTDAIVRSREEKLGHRILCMKQYVRTQPVP